MLEIALSEEQKVAPRDKLFASVEIRAQDIISHTPTTLGAELPQLPLSFSPSPDTITPSCLWSPW